MLWYVIATNFVTCENQTYLCSQSWNCLLWVFILRISGLAIVSLMQCFMCNQTQNWKKSLDQCLLFLNFLTYPWPWYKPWSIALGKLSLSVLMANKSKRMTKITRTFTAGNLAKKNCQTPIENLHLTFDCKYVSWSLLWVTSDIPLRQMWVHVYLEAISGTPLWEQEFALWETAVGMGLEVQIYSYTGRESVKIAIPWWGQDFYLTVWC